MVSRVERESYAGEVFDFSIPGDETFWAEGVLVHNCEPCKDINGTVFDTWLDAWKAYGGGPYHACLGRNRCRGTVRAIWNEASE